MKVNKITFQAILSVLILTLGTNFIVAQQGTLAQDANANSIGPSSYEVQKIPPAPEVASLGNYGNQPINKYNGTANINVPIHTVGLDDLRIPLTVLYNTGGNRVNQDATWVGLGWNMSTGITITREINGYDDLRNSGYTGKIVPGDSGKDNLGWIYSPADVLYYDNSIENYRISAQDLNNMDNNNWQNNNPWDLQPDLFTLNTPNGSCSFYLPKKGASNLMEAQVANNVNFKVVYNTDDFSFTVTDPDGYVYQFDYTELSTGFRTWETWANDNDALRAMAAWPTNQTKYMITAWKPSKIRSPMGRELVFEYESGHHFSFPSFQETYSRQVFSNAVQDQGWYQPTEVNFGGPNTVSASMNAFHNFYLKKISGDFGEVVFNLGNERLDLFSVDAYYALTDNVAWVPLINAPTSFEARRLNSIDVLNHLGDTIRTASFEYGYFNDNQIGQTVKERYLRLKLDKVLVNDQEYAFSYLECNSLPAKDSKAIDFWGFYNGANSNSHRIPSFNRFFFSPPYYNNPGIGHDQFYKFSSTVDRGSNSNYAKHGLLNKVRYPTKGITEYRYEGNSVALDRIEYKNNTDYSLIYGNSTNTYYQGGKRVSLRGSADYNFRYQYLKLQDSTAYSLYDYINNNDFPNRHVEEFEVGGLRVAQVIDKDYDGTPLLTRTYEYEESNNGGFYTSGRLMDDLVFHSKGIGSIWENTPENYSDNNSVTLYSDNMLRTSMAAAGSHIGYTRVTERTLDKEGNANGRMVNKYVNKANIPIVRDIPCTPQFITAGGQSSNCQGNYDCLDYIDINVCSDYNDLDRDHIKLESGPVYVMSLTQKTFAHENGKVTSEFVYNNNDDIVAKTLNSYEEVVRLGSTAPHFALMNWYQTGSAQYFPIGFPYQVVDGNTFGVNKEFRLSQSKTTQYFGSENIENTVDYEYGPHNQLVRVEAINSKGEVQVTKAFYPQDLLGEPLMNKMVDSNRTRIRVKSEVYRGTELNPEDKKIASQRNTFSDTLNTNGIVLPYEVKTRKGEEIEGPEETRQRYELYDNYGNLLQYRAESGIQVSFIYGYNHQYVVAKIENASYANIESVLGSSFDLGQSGLSETQETNLRNGLSQAMVTTVAYKPLVGVSHVTDPRGYTTKYIYDNNNRLKEVRDDQNNLVTDYQYDFISAISN